MAQDFITLLPDANNTGKKVASSTLTWNGATCYVQMMNLLDANTGLAPSIVGAGSVGSNVLTVQGNAAGIPIPVSGTFAMPLSGSSDAQAVGANQAVALVAFNATGGSLDRLRIDVNHSLQVGLFGAGGAQAQVVSAPADGVSPSGIQAVHVLALNYGFNGASYDRMQTSSVGVAASSGSGALVSQGICLTGSLASSAARTSAGTGNAVNSSAMKELLAFVNITATSGTGQTLDIYTQSQDPISGQWADNGGHIQISGSGSALNTPNALNAPVAIPIGSAMGSPFGSQVRVRWEINGTTPSFTFSVGYAGKG